MRKKVLTPQCPSCKSLETNMGKLECSWGNGKSKLLLPHKGKKQPFCNLKQGKEND